MSIRIERGRQFQGDAAGPLPLFERDGSLGGYLPAAAKKIAAQQNTVTLQPPRGAAITLATDDDWSRFFAQHAATQRDTKVFGETFGISFRGFVNVLDDLAMSDDRGIAVDLSPQSPISSTLSLASDAGDYALKLKKGETIDLVGPTTSGKAEAAGVRSLGPDLLAATNVTSGQRDRREQESWGDFEVNNRSWRAFRDNTGAAPFEKLYQPDWKDAEAMAVCERFQMPLHLEVSNEATATTPVEFQDRSELFRETYFTDADGILEKLGISLRLRIRFDKKDPDPNNPNAPEEFEVRRTLIQMKEDRQIDPITGGSSVHKIEERYWSDVVEADVLEALLTGKGKDGRVLGVMQKLYKLVADSGLLPADGLLKLEPESVVFQKRRRTHLQLDSAETVKGRLDAAIKDRDGFTTASQPVPEALTKWIGKLEQQHRSLTEAAGLLQKHAQWASSGEAFIISADRFNVYDPHSRSKQPVELDDEQGRVGRGLHVEAEWDSASSDAYEKAIAAIDKKLAATPAPANADELRKDREALEGFRAVFRADVGVAEKMQTERLLAAGLKIDPSKKSKEERAHDFMASRQNQALYWHS